MNSTTFKKSELKPSILISESITPKKRRLISQWIKVEGKLACQWITVER